MNSSIFLPTPEKGYYSPALMAIPVRSGYAARAAEVVNKRLQVIGGPGWKERQTSGSGKYTGPGRPAVSGD